MKGRKAMRLIYATYNQYCNSMITTFDNMLLRIDCNKAEDGLKTTPNSQRVLNTLAIDNALEYARWCWTTRGKHGLMRRTVLKCGDFIRADVM